MTKFAIFIVKHRWWVLAVWLIAAALIVSFSPKLSSVENNDESSFLPKGYESVKAIDVAKKISPQAEDATDIIVFKNSYGGRLTKMDKQTVAKTVANLNAMHLPHVAGVITSPEQIAPDGKIQLATIIYSGSPDDTSTINSVSGMRNAINHQLSGTDLKANTTGGESISYDTQGESNRALKIVGTGTIILVLVLPAIIFRSPFAGLLPVLAVGVIDVIASSLIADAATWFNFKVNQQLSIIFTVVLFGIGTDYILFLLFRYRERLRSGDHTRKAVAFALSRAGLAILSAALVVLSSFAALFFAKFGIFSSMAPGLVICVAVMMLAALTLVPALVAIVGQKVFWPSKAWQSKSLKATVSKRIGRTIARRPAVVAGLVAVALLVLAAFALGYKSDFSSFSEPPAGTQSAAGYNDLVSAFPAGVTDPAQIYVSSDTALTQSGLRPLEQALQHTTGVATILPPTIAPDSLSASIPVVLRDNPYSSAALTNIAGPIRDTAHSFDTAGRQVYVGGTTAIFVDIRAVSARDLRVIFPIAAVFIFIILLVLLRSLVAPLVLLIAVGLGYLATLGATTLIFIHLMGEPGLIFFIPLFMYIFVVAVGTDYNILTVTRLREEVRMGNQPRKAADLTVEHSSATVASAGLILASTFASLLLAKISFLSQMGSAIAIGVSLAAFVIAPFLIPSFAALLGYGIWWPSRLRPKADHSQDS